MALHKGVERVQRGKYHDGGMEGTARRAADHMKATKPRGKTFGASEAHAIAARERSAPPSGSFASRGKR
jgi:hypothetical protein